MSSRSQASWQMTLSPNWIIKEWRVTKVSFQMKNDSRHEKKCGAAMLQTPFEKDTTNAAAIYVTYTLSISNWAIKFLMGHNWNSNCAMPFGVFFGLWWFERNHFLGMKYCPITFINIEKKGKTWGFAKSCLVFNEVIRFLMTKLMGKTTTHKNFLFFFFPSAAATLWLENDAQKSEHPKIFYVLLIYHTFFDEFPLR